MLAIALICHPDTPCTAVQRVVVQVRRLPGGRLSLHYLLDGDLAGVCLPGPRPPRHSDELWRHTCCEAFLARRGETGYVECNFAPSTEWALYRFTGYRHGQTVVTPRQPPHISVHTLTDRLQLKVVVPLAELATTLVNADLNLAIATVVEAAGGGYSYWALYHPPARPDFHHPDSFTLRLAGNKRV